MRVCRLFVPSAPAAGADEEDAFGRFRDRLRGLIRLSDSTLCCIVGRHRCRTLGIIIKSTVATRVLLLRLCSFQLPKYHRRQQKTELDYSRFKRSIEDYIKASFSLSWIANFNGRPLLPLLLLQTETFNWLESTQLDDTDGFTANVFPSGSYQP